MPATLGLMLRPRRSVRLPPALTAALLLCTGFGLGLAWPVLRPAAPVPGQDAVGTPQSRAAQVTLEGRPAPHLHIRPAQGQADTLLVLYPGGLVPPQGYEWLGRALAAEGVETVIPVFPLNLAVTAPGRAGALITEYGAGKRVILGGHSLGGAMAARFAARHPGAAQGLLLLAAYPPSGDDLSGQPLSVLSLLAEHDGVADPADVRGGLQRLPPDTRLAVIPGAVHSFFGRYGPQRGDGTPTVSRAQAEAAVLREVTEWLKGR